MGNKTNIQRKCRNCGKLMKTSHINCYDCFQLLKRVVGQTKLVEENKKDEQTLKIK
jgi:uncharacterized OB-fold protein